MSSLDGIKTRLSMLLNNSDFQKKAEASRDWCYDYGFDRGEEHAKIIEIQANAQGKFVKDGQVFCPFGGFEESPLKPMLRYMPQIQRFGHFDVSNPSEFTVCLYIKGTGKEQHSSGAIIPYTYYKNYTLVPGENKKGFFSCKNANSSNISWDFEIAGIWFSSAPQQKKIQKVIYHQNYNLSTGELTMERFFEDSTNQWMSIECPDHWKPTVSRYFRGWNTSADGTGDWLMTGSFVNNPTGDEVHVYAIWGYEYTITYQLKSGSSTNVVRTYRGNTSSFNITLPTHTNVGFNITQAGARSFKAWGDRPQGYEVSYAAGSTFSLGRNRVLYGVWNY